MRLNESIYVEKSVILNSSRVHENNCYVHKIPPEVSRNSVGIFHGIPSEFFHEIPKPKNSVPRNFLQNSAEFFPLGKFRGILRNLYGIPKFRLRNSVKYNSAGIFCDGIINTLHVTSQYIYSTAQLGGDIDKLIILAEFPCLLGLTVYTDKIIIIARTAAFISVRNPCSIKLKIIVQTFIKIG